jgi:hypothetical protein
MECKKMSEIAARAIEAQASGNQRREISILKCSPKTSPKLIHLGFLSNFI